MYVTGSIDNILALNVLTVCVRECVCVCDLEPETDSLIVQILSNVSYQVRRWETSPESS